MHVELLGSGFHRASAGDDGGPQRAFHLASKTRAVYGIEVRDLFLQVADISLLQ